MKAVVQTEYGDPLKVLALQDVPEIEPAPGQVILAMETAVVHSADVRTVLGSEGFRKRLPRTPGYEGLGRIHTVGRDVEGLEVGMRVFAPLGCGTYRERVAVDAASLVHAPEGDAAQVVLLSLSPATAILMLEDFAKLEPDDWIIQNAANSSVGRMVIQLAREMGLRVVNIVKSSPLIPELKAIGAGSVLLDTDDLRDRVLAITQGAPIRLALDAVGGQPTARLAACLAEDGIIISYGSLSGMPCQIPSDMLSTRGIQLRGINAARQLAKHTPEERLALYNRIGDWLAAGRLQARLAATYEFEDAIAAIRYAMSNGDKRAGKVVIRINHIHAPPRAARDPVAAPAAAPASAEVETPKETQVAPAEAATA